MQRSAEDSQRSSKLKHFQKFSALRLHTVNVLKILSDHNLRNFVFRHGLNEIFALLACYAA